MKLFFKKNIPLTHPALKSIGVYTFTNFLTRSTSFFLVFIFTNPKYITPAENGILSIFNNSILFLRPVVALGLIHSAGTDFFKLRRSEFNNLFTSGVFLSFCVTIFTFLSIFLFFDAIKAATGFPDFVIYLIPWLTFFIFCIEQNLGLSRSNNDPGTFFRTNVSRLVIEMGSSILLVVAFSFGWKGRALGFLISNFIIGFWALMYFYRSGYLRGSIKKTFIKSELLYSIPIIALQYSLFALYSSDKFFLAYFFDTNTSVVGVYSVASIFGSVIFAFQTAINQYVSPKIYATLSSPNIDYMSLRRQFYILFLFMAAVTTVMIVGTPIIYKYFINSLYHDALDYFYLLCLGYFFWSLTNYFYAFLLFRKEKKKILAVSFLSIVIGLLGNYIFIQSLGGYGAALAVFWGFFIVFIISIIFTFKDFMKIFFQAHKEAA